MRKTMVVMKRFFRVEVLWQFHGSGVANRHRIIILGSIFNPMLLNSAIIKILSYAKSHSLYEKPWVVGQKRKCRYAHLR